MAVTTAQGRKPRYRTCSMGLWSSLDGASTGVTGKRRTCANKTDAQHPRQLRRKRQMPLLLAIGAVLALMSAPAAAQYPAKPITVIVPFAAGGPTDVVTRLIGDHMSRTLGQTLV